MKNNGYMDRALRARDPRFARVLGKMGYERSDLVPSPPVAPAEGLTALRDEYERALG